MSSLILASASAVRAQLLGQAGVPFEVDPAHVDEETVKESLLAERMSIRNIADALAELKAIRVSARHPQVLVLGADQVLEFEGTLVSKVRDRAEARALLQRLRGKPHVLHSAVVLAKGGSAIWRDLKSAKLWMRDFSDSMLDRYLAAEGERLLSGVGCYRIEERGIQLFQRVEGDYFAIMGLPLLNLLEALREHGVMIS